MRCRAMRWLTPRIRREFASIARCASSTKPISSAAEPGSAVARLFSLRSCLIEVATASPKRVRSGSTEPSPMRLSLTGSSPRSPIYACPIAIPGDTPIPESLCSFVPWPPGVSSILIELAVDQAGERLDRGRRVAPGRGDLDGRARGGGEHHQPHDRAAGDRRAVLAHPDLGVELRRGLDEAGGGARVQPL